jgi:hypothetical protein
MKQLTLDYFFCGKKTKRDELDLDDEDILQCYEEMKKKEKEEEDQKMMELVWNDFEMELLEDEFVKDYYCSGEAAKDLREEMERKPFVVCRELPTEERMYRRWKLGMFEDQDVFKYLPGNEDTLERKYWVDSEKIRLNKKIEEDPYYAFK